MNKISHHTIQNGSFPQTEHRISMIQVGVSSTAIQPVGALTSLRVPEEYTGKLRKALTTALRGNWANIVVLPEISVPA